MLRALAYFIAVLGLVVASLSPGHAAKRVALVIGNSGYSLISPLTNPKNDAELMAATLKNLGFEVHMSTDADRRAMGRAVRSFGKALRRAGKDAIGLFYYAGHGIQARGVNYLVPLGAEIEGVADLEVETLSASNVLAQMDEAGNALNLVILDACRNNPFKGKVRSAGRGLARISAASGTLIAFAAGPGQVAADGEGKNSPYTSALAKTMRQPGLTVEQMFKRVRVQVEGETGGAQTPWEESSLRGDFYFAGRGASATAPAGEAGQKIKEFTPAPQPPRLDPKHIELAYWNSIKNNTDPKFFKSYLSKYPNGDFVEIARLKIRGLSLVPEPIGGTGPSFNCNYASESAEVAICKWPELSRLDVKMSALFFSRSSGLSGNSKRSFVSSQSLWISERNACGYNIECLRQKHLERIRYLGGDWYAIAGSFQTQGQAQQRVAQLGGGAWHIMNTAQCPKFRNGFWIATIGPLAKGQAQAYASSAGQFGAYIKTCH